MHSLISHRTTGNTSTSSIAIDKTASDKHMNRIGAIKLSKAESRKYARFFPKREHLFVRIWRFLTR